MQTFLTIPTTDFTKIAESLDRLRLNKQALEAWQLLMTNLSLDPDNNYRKPKAWYNHPAAVMWKGYEVSLYYYIKAMTDEWIKRGYKTTILDKATETMETAQASGFILTSEFPYWMKNKKLYNDIVHTHRVALLAKDYEWYSKFNWPEDTGKRPDEYNYIWYK
jgi:hypothetical protein